jgi:hypothetical protein
MAMSVRIYVAASSAERDRARRAIAAVCATPGLELTHDWLTEIEATGVTDRELDRAGQRAAALTDLHAIRRAQVLWLLAPAAPSQGAGVEWGWALASAVLPIVSGPAASNSIFSSLAGLEFATDELALDYLRARGSRAA